MLWKRILKPFFVVRSVCLFSTLKRGYGSPVPPPLSCHQVPVAMTGLKKGGLTTQDGFPLEPEPQFPCVLTCMEIKELKSKVVTEELHISEADGGGRINSFFHQFFCV